MGELLKGFKDFGPNADKVDTVIFPPSCFISTAQTVVEGSSIKIGIQNISKTGEGAYTGEVTAGQANDSGVKWVLIGHSERRALYGETDEETGTKVEMALAYGQNAMVCIGESLEERQSGSTIDVCQRQLSAFMHRVYDWSKVVIAYEPVWAIGTGVVATPMQAQETHSQIRQFLRSNIGESIAQSTRILYGGSVSPGNCMDLGKLPDVDGFLVGGASLKSSFTEIIGAAQDLYKV